MPLLVLQTSISSANVILQNTLDGSLGKELMREISVGILKGMWNMTVSFWPSSVPPPNCN